MSLIKCDKCGADIIYTDGADSAICAKCWFSQHIDEQKILENSYLRATEAMDSAKKEADFKAAAAKFEDIKDFRDSAEKAARCLESAEAARVEAIYNKSVIKAKVCYKPELLEDAIKNLKSISGYLDAKEKAEECEKKLKAIVKREKVTKTESDDKRNAENAVSHKKAVKNLIVFLLVLFLVCGGLIAYFFVIPNSYYKKGMEYYSQKKYESAVQYFVKSKKLSKASAELQESYYFIGMDNFEKQKYEDAVSAFSKAKHFKTSKEMLKKSRYALAEDYIKDKQFDAAKPLYSKLGKYLDSKQKYYYCKICTASEKSTVYYGRFEQNNNISNGTESIGWKILKTDKENNRVLIATSHAIASKSFGQKNWEKSELRSWLNGEFFDTVFTDFEKSNVLTSQIETDGATTSDKVFCLSASEANEYFADDNARRKTANNLTDKIDICSWWLRNSGKTTGAAAISTEGEILESGISGNESAGIVAAMWVNMD